MFRRIELRLIIASVFFVAAVALKATPLSETETAEQFFDKFASILLKEELAIDLHHIPIYPTNLYSRELHRLLQVTANLYDSTTNRGDAYPWFPTCFRPRFGANGEEVFISGYVEEPSASFTHQPWRDVEDPTDRPINADDNVYGIPIIIGARRGFPNFNEFVFQTALQVTRKLELRKDRAFGHLIETNQMMLIGISNTVALEMWNPWTNAYPRALALKAVTDTVSTFTNEHGFGQTTHQINTRTTNIAAGTIAGNEFRVPLLATELMLPDSIYRSSPDEHFDSISTTNVFESDRPTNQWGLLTKTRLIFVLFDGSHLIDFLALSDLTSALDVSAEVNSSFADPYGFWNPASAGNVSFGMRNQLEASLGNISFEWNTYGIGQLTGTEREKVIASFRNFVLFPGTNTNVAQQAPFTPTRKIVQRTDWEVNDPFVHQLRTDLLADGINPSTGVEIVTPPGISVRITDPDWTSIGYRNRRYSPWGDWFNPNWNPNVRDAGVWSPNEWAFPSQLPLSLATIGQIHRGTPWQTIYLKSAASSADDWLRWYGDASGHPTNDWQLVSILSALLNTNPPQTLVSINASDVGEWSSLFDGITVTSNTPDCLLVELTVNSNAKQVATIVNAIGLARETLPGGYFDSIGGLLSVPELTVSSPWLADDWMFCGTDAMLEAIPSQLLPKLRPDPVAHILNSVHSQLQFSVIPGQSYELQASDDLRTWRAVSTNIVDESSFTFWAPLDLSQPQAFYRLRLLP